MARIARSSTLESRDARSKLPQRHAAYWRKIHKGLAIGYRKGTNGSTWIVRKAEGKSYRFEAIGSADDHAEANGKDVLSYAQAQRRAFAESDRKAISGYTVEDAADDYLTWFKAHSKSHQTTKQTVDAHILPKFKTRKLESLTTSDLVKWHQELVTARQTPKDDPDAVRRYRSTSNRVLTVFKAMLNHAWRHENVKDNSAWQKVKPFQDVDDSRKVFLTEAQCKKLINISQGDFRALIQSALYTGARYGELTILRVKDFDATEGTLNLADGKTGARVIFLTDEGNRFFKRQIIGKKPDDLILMNNGKPWGKSHHIRLFNRAAKLAELPEETSFYALRHTYVSLAAKNGMPLQVLAENCGTSVRMIELNYGKYLNADRRKMINAALPNFGLKRDNVRAI